MTTTNLFKRIFPWIGWVILLAVAGLLIVCGYFYKKSATTGRVEFFGGYKVSWGVFSNSFELSKDNQVLEKFRLPVRPLAVWYRPSTGTMAIVTSEFANGKVNDNHLLYIRKDQVLRQIYHSVVGYDLDHQKWLNSSLYQANGLPQEQANAVYMTPNEEYLIAREYGYGYSPRVFRVGMNGLISGSRLTFETQNLYWSPSGRCVIHLGETGQNGWGFFQKPTDFVYYSADSIDLTNIQDIQVWWKSDQPCEGYVSLRADHFGGEGDSTQINQVYNYVIGEGESDGQQIGITRIATLPTNLASFAQSLTNDWQMIMVTKP